VSMSDLSSKAEKVPAGEAGGAAPATIACAWSSPPACRPTASPWRAPSRWWTGRWTSRPARAGPIRRARSRRRRRWRRTRGGTRCWACYRVSRLRRGSRRARM
jgi:hypothetical protein